MRIVVFADWDHWVPRALMRSLLSELPIRPTVRVVAVCIPRPIVYWHQLFAHMSHRVVGYAKRLCLSDRRYLRREPRPVNLRALARRHGFDVLVVHDVNSAEAARWVRERQPDAVLSLFWKRKFAPAFLALFKQAVNYHNGSVPDYRGLRATPWAMYNGESHSGFTFHRISERLDLGNVLVEGEVPIERDASVFDVERAKTRSAALRLPAVIDAMLANAPGTPQRDPTKYNHVRDIARLVHIEEPASLRASELLRRIRAFGPVQVRLGSELVWVSGLGAPVVPGDRPGLPSMRLADGVWRLKTSDWRAHRLKRIARRVTLGRTTVARP